MKQIRMSELLAPVFAPVHTDIRRGGHAEYWLYGGRGSGKSSFVSIEIVLGMMKDPQANALVVRRVAKTLRQSVYEQLCWAIDRLGVDHLWARRLSPMELIYRPTGQRILFIGADDPQKSKGIKVSRGSFKFLWFEELAEFDGMGAVNTITASAVRGDSAVTFTLITRRRASPTGSTRRRCASTRGDFRTKAAIWTSRRTGWVRAFCRKRISCAGPTSGPIATCTWAK